MSVIALSLKATQHSKSSQRTDTSQVLSHIHRVLNSLVRVPLGWNRHHSVVDLAEGLTSYSPGGIATRCWTVLKLNLGELPHHAAHRGTARCRMLGSPVMSCETPHSKAHLNQWHLNDNMHQRRHLHAMPSSIYVTHRRELSQWWVNSSSHTRRPQKLTSMQCLP